MAYKYVVVWFNPAKSWISGTYKTRTGKAKKYTRPLEINCKPFRSLERAKEFQKTWCKPYPRIYELKEGYSDV